jgi:pimeloyl-ACP methyl ester carboxylesterase
LRNLLVAAAGQAIYTRVFPALTPTPRLPVILVPGFLVSGRYMIPAADILCRDFAVAIPDLPGHGRSEKPTRALSVPEYADVLAAWADALGLDRALYVGHSFGCQIVAALAVRHPGRAAAAVLAGPTVDPAIRSVPQLAARLAVDFLHERPSLIAVELRDFWDMGLRLVLGELCTMLDDRITDRLPLVRQPVLLTRGSLDPVAPSSWVHRAAHSIPHASVREIPDAPHAANYSAPQRFVETILPFLMDYSG